MTRERYEEFETRIKRAPGQILNEVFNPSAGPDAGPPEPGQLLRSAGTVPAKPQVPTLASPWQAVVRPLGTSDRVAQGSAGRGYVW